MTTSGPLFSIITVSLNNVDGLLKTYGSLLKQLQSFQNYEWIVIDGGSTDESVTFLKTTDATWISEPDRGLYDAMNKGIEAAKGEYLLFLNAGDEMALNFVLENLTETIRKSPIQPDFIYGDSYEFSNETRVFKAAKRLKRPPFNMFTHHQAMIYRRKAIGDLRYDLSYKIAADYDFTCRFLEHAEQILYCPGPICIFERGGISQQNAALGRREQFEIRRNLELCPALKNNTIKIAQAILWTLRQKSPLLYKRLYSGRAKRG